jgi:hypothetical protein
VWPLLIWLTWGPAVRCAPGAWFTFDVVNEGDASAGVQAPIAVVAASVLLWIQGAIWAALGTLVVLYYPGKMTAGGLLIAVFFGFTALSGTLPADGPYVIAYPRRR